MSIKRKIIRWLKRDWYNDEACDVAEPAQVVGVRNIGNSHDSYTFSVTRADGGMIVEFNKYDNVKDRTCRGLHVIPDDADFNHELVKIVGLELLKH